MPTLHIANCNLAVLIRTSCMFFLPYLYRNVLGDLNAMNVSDLRKAALCHNEIA